MKAKRIWIAAAILVILAAGLSIIGLKTQHAAKTARHENGSSAIATPNGFFSTASIEELGTVHTASQGDLWPSCWSGDGNLYAANGDGAGFTLGTAKADTPPPIPYPDIAVSRISGTIGNLSGKTLAAGDQIGQIWDGSSAYNRKPTGMLCENGNLYLAVQDLSRSFNDVPSATIAKSTDHGKTWTWDKTAPMFHDHVFTTIMFLDYGKDSSWNTFDHYVYAYGLDNNWRDSFDDSVPDPQRLYLARIPKDKIQDRSAWQFYAGDLNGHAAWSPDIAKRQPVLEDKRRIYGSTRDPSHPSKMSVVSQGGIVYDKALKRYIYTSWTEYTFEFYEAPKPWGPWKKFMTKDFGGYPWSKTKQGGYAATIPSKFISPDGKTMYVQSNTFVGGVSNYSFSLRKLVLQPYTPSQPVRVKGNLAVPANGTVPIEKSAHYGHTAYYNDGDLSKSEDSWDQENKTTDWWGYTWAQNFKMSKVVYTTGKMFPNGGWFSGDLRVQVRQDFKWVDVSNLKISPNYPYDHTAGPFKTYTFRFDETWGDGVRMIGTPGGKGHFTSIGELAVYDGKSKG